MTARISQSILKNDKKKWQATYILTRKRQPISHFLKQYSFLLFFIARRMKRPSSSTTLIAMNRSSPHWSSTARSRKSEKKKKKTLKAISKSQKTGRLFEHARLSVTSVKRLHETKRYYTCNGGRGNTGVEKNPV